MPLGSYMSIRVAYQIIALSSCLSLTSAFATGSTEPTTSSWAPFPNIPGISLLGSTGDGWMAAGDIMAPIFGQAAHFTYIDPQVIYHGSPDEYTASFGLGQRWLTDNSVWGVYLFGDDNHADQNKEFWFLSPGVERLGRVWDFSVNAYLPITNRRFNTGAAFADQTGDYSQVTFSGHNQYDAIVNTFTATGWGFDQQIGVRLASLHNLKLSVGAYYFAPADSDNIIGGTVRLEMPLTAYLSATFSEAYDSQAHNVLKGGLSIALGGRSSGVAFTGDLTQRMVDPVRRQLIAVAGSATTGEAIVAGVKDTGQIALEASNISFFLPDNAPAAANGPTADGSYENPYHGFSQDNINDANQQGNHNLYVIIRAPSEA